MAQQDDYFYEIQLTNKQLVFYFLAGATGLILAFLAGVMVGRGVEEGEVQAARPSAAEERVITEETPRPAPSAQDLTYTQRLETERPDDRLERPRPSPAGTVAPPVTRPAARATPAPARATPVPVRRTADAGPPARPPAGAPGAAAPAAAGTFSLQVGAFKDRGSADSVVVQLKGKGFAAYVVSHQEGLFNVRVGNYGTRPEAESMQEKLKAQNFSPFIVRN